MVVPHKTSLPRAVWDQARLYVRDLGCISVITTHEIRYVLLEVRATAPAGKLLPQFSV